MHQGWITTRVYADLLAASNIIGEWITPKLPDSTTSSQHATRLEKVMNVALEVAYRRKAKNLIRRPKY